MQPEDWIKSQKIVSKIQSGEFDENDVDNLFIKLRESSDKFPEFREIGDLVAHSSERNKGGIVDDLRWLNLYTQFINEGHLPTVQDPFDLSKPFPSWILDLMKYQIRKADDAILRKNCNMGKSGFLGKLNSKFKRDKKSKMVRLKGRIGDNTIAAIEYVMGEWYFDDLLKHDEFLETVIAVLKENNLNVDEVQLRLQSDKIAMSIMYLLHRTKIVIDDKTHATCAIEIISNRNLRNFGCLGVYGTIPTHRLSDGATIFVTKIIYSTNLVAVDWCDGSLLHLPKNEIEESPLGELQVKIGDSILILNSEFKLAKVS